MVTGIITLDGEDIGMFEIFASGLVQVEFTKIANNLPDVLEFASENGMTIALDLRPSFDDYVPNHKKDAPSPK